MRRSGTGALASLLLAAALVASAPASAGEGVEAGHLPIVVPHGTEAVRPQPAEDTPFEAGVVLVRLRPGTDTLALASRIVALGGTGLEPLFGGQGGRLGRWHRVRLTAGLPVREAIDRLAGVAGVERAEPNFRLEADLLPGDFNFAQQWGLHNTGQTGGIADADIDAAEAWDVTVGDPGIVIAIIDTGIDSAHVDLAANLWVNPGEIPANGLDDDANGFVDDIHGYDWVNGDGDPQDDNGHGTHVGGIVAAPANGLGVVGTAWQGRLMALKFLDAAGSGFTDAAAMAIQYAIDNGARLINASWGGGAFSQLLEDAIAAADAAGILFVAAAGNDGLDNDLAPHYPSSYEVPNVVAVAASDASDTLATFSNFGATSVDIVAPGVEILSTWPGDLLAYLSGTSMAAPFVTGTAALLLAGDPLQTPAALKERLLTSGDLLPQFTGRVVSGARLNAGNAVGCAPGSLSLSLPSHPAGFLAWQGEPTRLLAELRTCGAPVTGASMVAVFDNGEPELPLFDDGLHGDRAAADGVYGAPWTPAREGPLTLRLDASDALLGSATISTPGEVVRRVDYLREEILSTWIDTSAGDPLVLGDDDFAEIPIGFLFPYYGREFDRLVIGSNGLLTFSMPGAGEWNNTPLPDPAPPNGVIAPFWDDLDPGVAGTITSLLEGTAPTRRLTVSWEGVPHVGGTDGGSFQATLYEENGEIVYRYRDVLLGSGAWDLGGTATVGIEDWSGSFANLYGFNSPRLADGLALRFFLEPPTAENRYRIAIDTTPVAGASGWIAMEFIDGDGVNSNHLELFRFESDGTTITDVRRAGDATGSFLPGPGRLGDAQFISEISQPEIHGGSILFEVAITGNGTYAPFPDSVAFYLMDDTRLPYATEDPLGTNALVAFEIDRPVPLPQVFASAFATATVTPAVDNLPPVADPGGPYTGVAGSPVTFDGSASSDPEGATLTYLWEFGDGSTGSGVAPSHTYATAGTYTVTLVVSDGTFDSDPVSTQAVIEAPANLPPTADAGPDRTVRPRRLVRLDGRGSSDPDGQIVSYRWRQISGRAVRIFRSHRAVGYFLSPRPADPLSPEVLEFELEVTDDQGSMATDRVVITVGIPAAGQ